MFSEITNWQLESEYHIYKVNTVATTVSIIKLVSAGSKTSGIFSEDAKYDRKSQQGTALSKNRGKCQKCPKSEK